MASAEHLQPRTLPCNKIQDSFDLRCKQWFVWKSKNFVLRLLIKLVNNRTIFFAVVFVVKSKPSSFCCKQYRVSENVVQCKRQKWVFDTIFYPLDFSSHTLLPPILCRAKIASHTPIYFWKFTIESWKLETLVAKRFRNESMRVRTNFRMGSHRSLRRGSLPRLAPAAEHRHSRYDIFLIRLLGPSFSKHQHHFFEIWIVFNDSQILFRSPTDDRCCHVLLCQHISRTFSP